MSRLSLNTLTSTAVEQSKIVRWSESPCNQSGRKGKGLWRKGFAEAKSRVQKMTLESVQHNRMFSSYQK